MYSSDTGGGILLLGRCVDGCSGAMEVASELTMVSNSEPESSGGMVAVLVD